MRAPLSVRVNDGTTDRLLSKGVTGLRWRKSAPGGHADASCRLDLPRSTFGDLGPADRLWVTETDTARTLWEGTITNPGARTGADGEGWDLSALGGMSRASDRSERLVYLDAAFDRWERDWLLNQARSANIGVGQFPEDAGTRAAVAALLVQFTPGQPVTTNSRAVMRYRGFEGSQMTLGAVAGFYDAGQNDPTGYELRWGTGGTAGGPFHIVAMSTSGDYMSAYAGAVGDFQVGAPNVSFGLYRIGAATNVGTDDVWAAFGEVQVLGHLVDRFGVLRTMSAVSHVTSQQGSPPARAHVLAHEVVEDLVGRGLIPCDPNKAVIEAAAFQINQLAYHDPATGAGVLDDLAFYESDFLWEVLADGVFRYRRWPTEHRYVIGSREDVEVQGSDVDLCNRIMVTWTDIEGNPQVTFRYADVPELGGNPDPALALAGVRVRDADPIPLPEGRGSLANANRVGDEVLASKAKPPRAARATVDRPIFDRLTGRDAQPWQIEPGYLARLMETGEDLRLTELEYDDDSCTATLTLGDPVLTVEQRIALLDAVRAA